LREGDGRRPARAGAGYRKDILNQLRTFSLLQVVVQ
jgi:hypothetical protein